MSPSRFTARTACLVATFLLGTALSPKSPRAEGGSVLGEASRAAALGGAVTGRPGTLGAITANPAGLADLDGPALSLSTQIGRVSLGFARHGEPEQDMDRWISGFGFTFGAPLPEPVRAVRLGVSVYLPFEHVLRIEAPVRSDVPAAPVYGSRLEHISLVGAMGLDIGGVVSIGAALSITPSLDAPTRVRYVPGRGETPDENVVIEIERELDTLASALAGLRLQVIETLSIGLSYRQAVSASAAGPNDTIAGSVVVNDAIDFYDYWAPEEVAAGVALTPAWPWSLSLDLVWSRWSGYRTIHNRVPDPQLEDVWVVRTGFEWSPWNGVQLRAGYGYEPSPVPPQVAESNFIDGDRHVLAAGVGLDLHALLSWSMALDLHVRTHITASQTATKQADRLPDADPEATGRQIDNLGYPGFSASGGLWQAGLTLTLFFGDGGDGDGP